MFHIYVSDQPGNVPRLQRAVSFHDGDAEPTEWRCGSKTTRRHCALFPNARCRKTTRCCAETGVVSGDLLPVNGFFFMVGAFPCVAARSRKRPDGHPAVVDARISSNT